MTLPRKMLEALVRFARTLPPEKTEVSAQDLAAGTGYSETDWNAVHQAVRPLLHVFIRGEPEFHGQFVEEFRAKLDPVPTRHDLTRDEALRLVARRALSLIEANQEFSTLGLQNATGVPQHHARALLAAINDQAGGRIVEPDGRGFYTWGSDTADVLRTIAFPLGETHDAPPWPTGGRIRLFYAWQSDLPNKTNRGLVRDALERACRDLERRGVVEVAPFIDRDTQGVPGMPDIGNTILEKIDACHIFVGDLSMIGEARGRPVPNPNVTFELGYALRGLGFERCIAVMNTAFGSVETLPFDLKQKRACTYAMALEEKPANARRVLGEKLVATLTAIVSAPSP